METHFGQSRHHQVAPRVTADRGHEEAPASEACDLDRGHGGPAGRQLPGLGGVDDVAGLRDPFDEGELRHLDMSYDCDLHG